MVGKLELKRFVMVWDTSFVPQLCWILIEMGFVGQNLPKVVPLYHNCKLVAHLPLT